MPIRLEGYAPNINPAKVVSEIVESESRMTGSGLYRTDRILFGEELNSLANLLENDFGPGLEGDVWAMELRPGAEEVFMHVHNDWKTAIWYPTSHVSPLLLESEEILPGARDLVLLAAGEAHGIAANLTDYSRFSVVMTYA